MKGVVPAAGEGTRIRPIAGHRPKGLVEVAGRPLLAHAFESLRSLGVTELVVVVGAGAGDVVGHFGDDYRGTPVTYVHQRARRGLAHAVALTEPHVDAAFVVLNGDNVCRANLGDLLDRHEATDADATLLVEETSPARARQTGTLDVEEGRVVGMTEKPADPPSTLVARGCYVLSPVVFHACELVRPSARGEYELSDAIDLLVAAGRPVETVRIDGWCVNVNDAADRRLVESRLR